MRDHTPVVRARQTTACRHFVLLHHCHLRGTGSHEVVPRNHEFNNVDALTDHQPGVFPDLFGAVEDLRETFMVHMQLPQVAQPAGHGEFWRGSLHAWPRDLTRINLITDNNIESRLGRGAVHQSGETVIEHSLHVMHGDEHMLLHGDFAGLVEVCSHVGIGRVSVTVDQAWHQCGTVTVDDCGTVPSHGVSTGSNSLDTRILDEDLAQVRRTPTSVENHHVGEYSIRHGPALLHGRQWSP